MDQFHEGWDECEYREFLRRDGLYDSTFTTTPLRLDESTKKILTDRPSNVINLPKVCSKNVVLPLRRRVVVVNVESLYSRSVGNASKSETPTNSAFIDRTMAQ